jgi:hypothetical protein
MVGKDAALSWDHRCSLFFDYQTHDPHHALWSVLDTLLDESKPNAIAILAHAVDAVTPPPPQSLLPRISRSSTTASTSVLFECIHRISGYHFDMRTRSGDDSDFEISIYRRRRRRGQQDDNQQPPVGSEEL